MKEGKLSNELLEQRVLNQIKHKRKETLIGPGVGEDCGALDFGSEVCVVTTDPITGATQHLGQLALHVSCNDIASAGVEPIGVTLTILAPVGTTGETIAAIMAEAQETAETLNVDIIGGHTEITSAVNRVVLSVTAIGKGPKHQVISTGGGRENDLILMTKAAAIEGTAIIAAELRDFYLEKGVDITLLKEAEAFSKQLSVVPEGLIAGRLGPSAMHDATEGGILGAVWELAEASGLGVEVNEGAIPVKSVTKTLCDLAGIDPLRLISSGSMIIACSEAVAIQIQEALQADHIDCTVIGRLVQGPHTIIGQKGQRLMLEPPREDELYKIFTSDLQSR